MLHKQPAQRLRKRKGVDSHSGTKRSQRGGTAEDGTRDTGISQLTHAFGPIIDSIQKQLKRLGGLWTSGFKVSWLHSRQQTAGMQLGGCTALPVEAGGS